MFDNNIINYEKIDGFFYALNRKFADIFYLIKVVLNSSVDAVDLVLTSTPWWVFILFVITATYKVRKQKTPSIGYGLALFFIKIAGLWQMMCSTLSLVIVAVFISVISGFPTGILMSVNNKLDRFMRPVLDAMQTMPAFVYLIPAVIFFGLGKAPAVIATVVYAICPMIRLTNHSLRNVDPQVVEAAAAFGSTEFQIMYKVKIPQAISTIAAGINQTMMMAVSMVVTCSMIGAGGLGMEVLIAVNRIEIGRGLLAGSAIVIVAIILDRLTQGNFEKYRG